MRIRKSLPPAAAPLTAGDLVHGLAALLGVGSGERVEREIGDRLGSRHVFSLSSGKAALCLLLTALKRLKNRRKVVIPGYTCFTVPSAVKKAGLEVVVCDVRSDTLDFDFGRLEEVTDEDTLCIVPTHLFGIRSDVGRAREIADRKGIFVVEDSAQAFPSPGGEGERVCGDAEFFSFGRGKNITCGSGGILLTASEEIADAVRGNFDRLATESRVASIRTLAELSLMGAFMRPWLYWLPDGLPFLKLGETIYNEEYQPLKINKVKYGFMYRWAENIRSANATRTGLGEKYKDALGVDRKLHIYKGCIPYLRFPIYMKDAEAKSRVLGKCRHLGVSGMYPGSVAGIREIGGSVSAESCPVSERIAGTLVTLPTHRLVTEALFDDICAAVSEGIR